MTNVYFPFLEKNIVFYDREELKEFLIQSIYNKSNFRVMFLDEKKAFKALFSKEWRTIILKVDIFVCSSQIVSWMIKMLTGKKNSSHNACYYFS